MSKKPTNKSNRSKSFHIDKRAASLLKALQHFPDDKILPRKEVATKIFGVAMSWFRPWRGPKAINDKVKDRPFLVAELRRWLRWRAKVYEAHELQRLEQHTAKAKRNLQRMAKGTKVHETHKAA
jgi:hypothetical protein